MISSRASKRQSSGWLGNVSALKSESGARTHWTSGSSCSTPRSIVEWNDWVARASGISRQSALGTNLFAVFPSFAARRDCRRHIDDALQFGSSSILTHTLNRLLPLHGSDGSNCSTTWSCVR